MKKLIALAVAATVATSANAWNTGVNNSDNVAGELLLTVWNPVTGKSFIQDLNVYTSTFLKDAGRNADNRPDSLSIVRELSQEGLAYTGTEGLMFTVLGANMDRTTTEFAKDAESNWRSNRGMVFTAENLPTIQDGKALNEGSVKQSIAKLLVNVNNSTQVNEDVWVNEGLYSFGNNDQWGIKMFVLTRDFLAGTGAQNVGDINKLMMVQYMDDRAPAPFTGEDAYVATHYANVTVDLAAGTVNIQEVPVPAAAWLFGSAIAGLAGLRRRK